MEQIEAIVGGPAGVYSNRMENLYCTSGPPSLHHKWWTASDATLYVAYDTEKGRAIEVHIFDPPLDTRSFYPRVRDRFGF